MAHAIHMPRLGQSEEEATVLHWLKKEGEPVAKGDILLEIETDKAVLEVESYFEGVLLKISAQDGETVAVQSVIGYIGAPGEPIEEAPVPARPASTAADSKAETSPPESEPAASTPAAPASDTDETFVRISPRAARLAREHGIDPARIPPRTPGARIVEQDVKDYVAALAKNGTDKQKAGSVAEQGTLVEPPRELSRMRQAIAARMVQSVTTAPHFFLTVSVDVTDLIACREQLKAGGKEFGLTDFLLYSVAASLEAFPEVNYRTDGKQVWPRREVNLGIAVSQTAGLIVAVLHNADSLTLGDIHDRAADLVARARAGKLRAEEMAGSTFTISNLGMMDVENFTAIINPGESAILAVSSAQLQPAVRDGKILARALMKMTLSADHRLIDGALAARFMNDLRGRLENEDWKQVAGEPRHG